MKYGDVYMSYSGPLVKTIKVERPKERLVDDCFKVVCSSQHGYLWHSHMDSKNLKKFLKYNSFKKCTNPEPKSNVRCSICGR